MDMIIRKAVLADAEGITRIHVETWVHAHRKLIDDCVLQTVSFSKRYDKWKKAIRTQYRNYFIYVAEHEDGKIVGFAVGSNNRTKMYPYTGELRAIYVLEAFQGQGIGRKLMNSVSQNLRNIGLNSMIVWILKDNPYKSFYEKYSPSFVAEKYVTAFKALGIAYGWQL